MKYRILVLGLALAWPAAAQAVLLDPASVDASLYLPPPPAAGSPLAQAEVAELKAIHARSTPQMIAAAARDSKDEKPDMFNQALGFDLTALPQTSRFSANCDDRARIAWDCCGSSVVSTSPIAKVSVEWPLG